MPDWLVQVITVAGMGVGAYAAVRSDLARLHEIATQARDSAHEAHRRIDDFARRRSA